MAQMTGAKIDLVYERGYPVVVNHAEQTEVAHAGRQGQSPATPMCTTCRR